MIAVVVDRNVLRNSPYLTRREWVSLSDHRADWKVSLLVPDVVLMETINVVPSEYVNVIQDH
jgi:hypothetical protein